MNVSIIICVIVLAYFIVLIFKDFKDALFPKVDNSKCACCDKVFAENEKRTGLMFCGSASFCLSCAAQILKGH